MFLLDLILLSANPLFCLDLNSFDQFAQDYPVNAYQAIPAWLLVSFSLFFLGMAGMVFNYNNFLVTMMSVECMYLGIVTSFVFYGVAFNSTTAAIYGLLILIFAACESAVGLGLLVAVYRFGFTVGFTPMSSLGG